MLIELTCLIVKATRTKSGATVNPIEAYRAFDVRKTLIEARVLRTLATGL